jgi:hypothetical protein
MSHLPSNDDRREDEEVDRAVDLPERRLMAEGLPEWDLEPPTTLIRRPAR